MFEKITSLDELRKAYRAAAMKAHPDHGGERRKAIADYKAACKSHPGAETVLDIEKGRWER